MMRTSHRPLRRSSRLALCAGALLGLCSLPAMPASVHAQTEYRQATEKESLVATTQYRIGPEDVLEINVWRNKDLSKTVMVRPDGRISLPLIGDVRATGLTPQQLTNELRERYLKFLEEPNVSVMVKETNSYTFYVMGQVATPGRYFLKSKMTLLQAITIAGGFTPLADRSRIVVLRPNGRDTESRMTVSYIDIVLKDHANDNVVLSRGDTIVVPSETSVLLY